MFCLFVEEVCLQHGVKEWRSTGWRKTWW